MPSNHIRRVKNRIKHSILQAEQLIVQGNNNERCISLLHESQVNLSRIRSRISQDKFEVIKHCIEELMNLCRTSENYVSHSDSYCAERVHSGK